MVESPIMESLEISDENVLLERISSQSQLSPGATSSSSSKNTSPNKVGGSRRKSVHQRIMIDDDIEFVSDAISPNIPTVNRHAKASTSAAQYVEPPVKRPLLDDGDMQDNNPNLKLIRKVAFLRASVNYLMVNLGKEPFDFSGMPSLAQMYEQFSGNKETYEIDSTSEEDS